MNFLTKTLNSLTGQAIPYNKGSFVANMEGVWDVFDGTSKADGSSVSIFQFDKQGPSPSFYKFALNCSKKLSIIKFPGVLKTIEVIENDSTLYLITERVRPLSQTVSTDESRMLGVYNIAKTLKFVNVDANSVHAKVNMDSVFVTESGEWKLGGFEALTNLNDIDKSLLLQVHSFPTFHKRLHPPEVSKSLEVLLKGKTGIKFDAFSLGCFILEIYNLNVPPAELGVIPAFVKRIPRSLQAGVNKLLSDSVTTRATAELFLRKGEESFFDIELIHNFNDLQEIDFKSNAEKLEIFEKLSANVSEYPRGFVEFKLLPAMIQFYQFNQDPAQQAAAAAAQEITTENVSRILYHILQFDKSCDLSQAKFNKLIKPLIFQNFTKADRAIRMILLTSLADYIPKLEKAEINNTIFNNLVTGFNDTSAAMREETLKSVIVIAEHLTERQLNNELLRYLAKLQNDESETIRTNVVICLSRISHLMNKTSRANILITAFNKSIKDPFIPTRLSTIVAFGSCVDYFTPEIIASRILSSIAPSLLDKSFKIRQEADKIFKLFLEIIHTEAAKLPSTPDDDHEDRDIKGLGTKLADTSLGWGALNRFATPPIEDESSAQIPHRPSVPLVPAAENKFKNAYINDDDDLIDGLDDGWGHDDGDEEEDEKLSAPRFAATTTRSKPTATTTTTTTTRKPIKKTVTSNQHHGLKLQSKPKSSKLKLDLDLDPNDNGWGDGWD